MISIKSNIDQVLNVIIVGLEAVKDTDQMLRDCATTVLGMMKKRIHIDGLDANMARIGTYSKGYMIVRTGAYKNASRVTKGVNKGKLKDAGVFTKKSASVFTQVDAETVTQSKKFVKVSFQNKARPKYNRTADTKVVASLTRQMENDMVVTPIPGGYGIGYNNSHNYDKSQWVEATYNLKGKIFAISKPEEEMVNEIANQYIKNAIP